MIGNDVVDIIQARSESNWQRKGFLAKIFTLQEQALIQSCDDPETMVWVLWSIKEAAYKAYNRQTCNRGYFPFDIQCSILKQGNNSIKAIVVSRGFKYYTHTTMNDNVIHTIASGDKSKLNLIAEVDRFKIIKINKLPFIKNLETAYIKPASVSHHGRVYKAISEKF